MFEELDRETGTCFLICVVVLVFSIVSLWRRISLKSTFAEHFKSFCSFVYLTPNESRLSKRVFQISYIFLGKILSTSSLRLVLFGSKLNVLFEEVSLLGQRKQLQNCVNVVQMFEWLFYRSSRRVFSNF